MAACAHGTSESTTAHLTISVIAGAPRADMVWLPFRMAPLA
jgi:hypothetical protein